MSDSIHNKYVTQVFREQLDHYAPYADHVGDEEKNVCALTLQLTNPSAVIYKSA